MPMPSPTNRTRRTKTLPLSVKPAVVSFSVAIDPLVAIVGRHVKLSAQVRDAIRRDLAAAFEQPGVTWRDERSAAELPDPVLSTEDAAQLAGVSRPFMVKLIDAGRIELHQKVGNQRRVLRSAVLRWQVAERARQSRALRAVAQDLDEEIFGA